METQHWFIAYVLDVVKAILAEGVGFLILAIVGGFILRAKVLHSIDRGFKVIADTVGDAIAKSFLIHILPEIVRIRETTEKQIIGERVIKKEEEIPTTAEISESLQLIDQDIAAGNFQVAERNLITMRNQHPKDFRVLDTLFSLYLNPRYQKKADALELLLQAEDDFKTDWRFYARVAHAYMELKGIFTSYHARRSALDAAQKCIELGPSDSDSYTLQGLVYYTFDNLEEAISLTEKALEMAKDKKAEISCKNNLAFYYAATSRKDFKEKATKYANEAMEHDPQRAFYIDTIGFVFMMYGETRADLKQAIDSFNRALQMEPYDPDILRHLQEAYAKIKKLPFE